ncbi:MAG: phospho-sugar mutase [Clostridia bacterium]|nr:phospho-sugar mutase [Clostridia bacterium]
MEKSEKNFEMWLENVNDEVTKKELISIKNDKNEIEDRFGENIKFGTAGLRGVMEAGNNRINIYTVRKATQGLANYLNKNHNTPSVAISYDCRRNSKIFAEEVACVMAANGIKSYITKELTPTPFLSYLVRKLETDAGVMITASHNTAEYNGYKCYGSDGAQMNEQFASGVYAYIQKVDIFKDIKSMDFSAGLDSGMINFTDESLKENYITEILKYHSKMVRLSNIKALYTPLNGTGNKFVRKTLELAEIGNLSVVKSQENPDENFTTCTYPNPENLSAFDEALREAKSGDFDLILATDPDADRLGVCARHKDEYKLFSGNEIGILLTNYILERRKRSNTLPERGVVVKTIVSTMMVGEIAKSYGCEVRNVLTGFKNIAHEIADLESLDQGDDYLFGFEESNGYLCGSYVRDKDAVSAALLICEAAAYYKENFGKNLFEVLMWLYSKYGYFGEKTLSYNLKEISGGISTTQIMNYFRNEKLSSVGNFRIKNKKDYLKSEGVMKSDVLEFDFENDAKIIVRPSGTEPKIKFYLMAKSGSDSERDETINSLVEAVNETVQEFRN